MKITRSSHRQKPGGARVSGGSGGRGRRGHQPPALGLRLTVAIEAEPAEPRMCDLPDSRTSYDLPDSSAGFILNFS
ncbi:hypothetical protein EVAR_32935_1 [Eumeta japonica]|uniref:Uncharacterized protein n=1 Tax=Eumeta variegata TaxID=151549 RepID=A0A4C1X6M2_EUMVA|nr:hypothetical protein EVAR_32935_1 [Eumeta japonica]